jgi:hypothetical protein
MHSYRPITQCYIDESIHEEAGFVVTALVFASGRFDRDVAKVLSSSGLTPRQHEFKSSFRMDSNPKMRAAREGLLSIAGSGAKVAVYIGPFDNFGFKRNRLGKHSLQALQSTLVRNSIRPSRLSVYFDNDIFPSEKEANRLHRLFHYLRACSLYPQEDSCIRLGIQVADAVAHSIAQILKEQLTGKEKMVDIGGSNTGYPKGTMAPLGWELLMNLRHGFLTRPMAYENDRYDAAADPVIIDPINDDPANYGQNPVLLGWGVQVDPEASEDLRFAVERTFGKIWLGCIH